MDTHSRVVQQQQLKQDSYFLMKKSFPIFLLH